jgi:hypothetical protein
VRCTIPSFRAECAALVLTTCHDLPQVNVETKVNPEVTNQTRSAEDFVDTFAPVLAARGENFIDRVTHQSFAWRSIAYSKEVAPTLRTSALVDDSTLYPAVNGIPANSSVHGCVLPFLSSYLAALPRWRQMC